MIKMGASCREKKTSFYDEILEDDIPLDEI